MPAELDGPADIDEGKREGAQRIRASGVRAARKLGELRPRGGRSPWRALYRRAGGVFVIAATAPETQPGPRGFTAPWQSPRSG